MKDPLYLKDCYLKEWKTKVVSADKKFIVLEDTAFYPNAGGQPFDTGIIKKDGKEFRVVFVGKFSGKISHEVDQEGLKEGDEVECSVDWDRRYIHMRYHTAAHVLSAIINHETGAMMTGNQISAEKTRIDFSLEDFDREQIKSFEDKANDVIKKSLEVKTLFMPRDEVLKDQSLAKLAKGFPDNIKTFRVVDIVGFDKQACGGTHLKNISEIGKITVTKIDNKGANNRRVYFVME